MLLSPLFHIVFSILARLLSKICIEGGRAQGLARLIRKLLLNRLVGCQSRLSGGDQKAPSLAYECRAVDLLLQLGVGGVTSQHRLDRGVDGDSVGGDYGRERAQRLPHQLLLLLCLIFDLSII